MLCNFIQYFLTPCTFTVPDFDYCSDVKCPEGLVCETVQFRHQCMCPEGVTYYQPLGTNHDCSSKFLHDYFQFHTTNERNIWQYLL